MSPWNGEFEAPASIVMQSCTAATAPLKYIIMVLLIALRPPSSSVTLALLGLCGYSQVFEKFEKVVQVDSLWDGPCSAFTVPVVSSHRI